MSPKRDKTVPQLVEKFRREYPHLERSLLRKLIRLENPHLFKNNPSNLKTLDRHLKKAFKNEDPSPKGSSKEHSSFWRKQALEDFMKIRDIIINQDPDQLVLIPQATLLCIETYPELKQKLREETYQLEADIKWANNPKEMGWYNRERAKIRRLKLITMVDVRQILEKVFELLHES